MRVSGRCCSQPYVPPQTASLGASLQARPRSITPARKTGSKPSRARRRRVGALGTPSLANMIGFMVPVRDGSGTGKTFVEDPYAADLPRAVKARIGPVLGRVAAEPVKTAEDVSGPVAVETGTPRQVASPPLRLQSDALDRKDDLVPVLDARTETEIAQETVRPANADNPAVPTVVAGSGPSVPVQGAPSLLRTDAPEQEDLRLRVSVPTETAVRGPARLAGRPAPPGGVPTA